MNSKPFVAVVDPAVKTPEIDCFNRMMMLTPLPLTYHIPAIFGFDTLNELLNAPTLKGIVITGSAASVYDSLDWQPKLEKWLITMIDKQLPILALCYGHQLIAHLFGAKVGFIHKDKRKLKGVRDIVIEPCILTKNIAQQGSLIVSHREEVKQCPKDMNVLATSKEIPIDGLIHQYLPIWTLQAHPEATMNFVNNLAITVPDPTTIFYFGWSLLKQFFSLAGHP